MKTLNRILTALSITLGLALPAYAQVNLTRTTLTTALTDQTTTTVVVASSTGATANSTSLYIDNELMNITGVPNSTTVTVRRAAGGTFPSQHLANSLVYLANNQAFTTVDQAGRCVSTTQPFNPVINIRNGNIWNCAATLTGTQQWMAYEITPQSSAYPRTSVAGVAYTILPTDYIVALSTTLTGTGGVGVAGKSFTLPSHIGLAGKRIIIKDESGGLTATTYIILVGTIDGTNSGTTTVIQLKTAYQAIELYAGSGGWFTLWCNAGSLGPPAGAAGCR